MAQQTPLSMGFFQWVATGTHWSGLPFRPLEDLPDPGIDPASPSLQADSLPAEPSAANNLPSVWRQSLSSKKITNMYRNL